MASGERNDVDNQPGGSGNMDFTDMETSLKLEKTRAKSNFTRIKNKLLFLVEGDGAGTSREVRDACDKLDSNFEITLDVITRLSGLHTGNKDKGKLEKSHRSRINWRRTIIQRTMQQDFICVRLKGNNQVKHQKL